MYKFSTFLISSTVFFLIAFGMQPDGLAAQEQRLANSAEATPEMLKESQQVFGECQGNLARSAHYDCACFSKRFQEERMRAGSKISKFNILVDISNECFNLSGAAEYALKKCMDYGRQAFARSYDDGTTFKEFCQCASANYAIEFQTVNSYVSGKILNRIFTTSLLRCQNPLPGNKKAFQRLDQ